MLPKPPLVTVNGLQTELRNLLATLEEKLKESHWPKEREKIQERIDLLTSLHKTAIESARVDQRLYEAQINAFNLQQEDRQAAIKQAEMDEYRQECIKAGGNPDQFTQDWPEFEIAIIQEKMIKSLLGKKKSSISINL